MLLYPSEKKKPLTTGSPTSTITPEPGLGVGLVLNVSDTSLPDPHRVYRITGQQKTEDMDSVKHESSKGVKQVIFLVDEANFKTLQLPSYDCIRKIERKFNL